MLQLKFNAAADYHEAVPATVDEGRVIIVKNSLVDAGYSLALGLNGSWVYIPITLDAGELGIPVTQSDTAFTTADLAAGELRFRVSSTDILYTDWNDGGTVKSGPTDGTAMT